MPNSRKILALLVGLLAAGMAFLAPAANAASVTATGAAHAVAHHHAATHHHAASRSAMERHALHIALAKLGAPYVWGASGPSAFDCSGLTSWAFHHAGFHGLPRTAAEQASFAHRIPRSHMRPGDLVFFSSGGHVYHVGIFDGVSHGRRIIVDAPHTGANVRREAIWTGGWFAGTLR